MEHEQIKDLLPFYITGTLDRKEISIVVLHLCECEECRKQTAELCSISEIIKETQMDVPQKFAETAFDKIKSESTQTSLFWADLKTFKRRPSIGNLSNLIFNPITRTLDTIINNL